MIGFLKSEKPYLVRTKEGRELLRVCSEIVETPINPEEQPIEDFNSFVGSVGQMIWKGSDHWKNNSPKKPKNEDWDALEKHLAKKRKRTGGTFREMPGFSEIVHSLGGTIRNGKALCRCPAHADKSPSLSITEKDGKILIHCFAGCTFEQILDAMKHIAYANGGT